MDTTTHLSMAISNVAAALELTQDELRKLRVAIDETQKPSDAHEAAEDKRTQVAAIACGRRSRTRLRVECDGLTIERNTAAGTFVAALRRLGLERVQELKFRLCGLPLVGTKAPNTYANYRRVGQWYVVTHSDTETKRALLESIGRRLGAHLSVRTV